MIRTRKKRYIKRPWRGMIPGFSMTKSCPGSLSLTVNIPAFSMLLVSEGIWHLFISVTVVKVLHSRQGVETWVTSDGRAYFVELDETDDSNIVPPDSGSFDHRNPQVG